MNITINTYGGELTEQETDLILSKAKEIKGCDHVTVNIDGDWLDVKYLYQHTYKDDDSEGNRHVIGIGYAYKF